MRSFYPGSILVFQKLIKILLGYHKPRRQGDSTHFVESVFFIVQEEVYVAPVKIRYLRVVRMDDYGKKEMPELFLQNKKPCALTNLQVAG